MICTTLDSELINVSSWFKSNKLSINPNKSKCTFFRKSTKPLSALFFSIYIDNEPITFVHLTKFLGVTLDDKLSWTNHIASIATIISRNTGVLSKLCTFLPPYILFSLYITLILPFLNYCNIV